MVELPALSQRASVPLLAVGLLILLLAANHFLPGFLGQAERVGRIILGVMAAAGGIYTIYSGMKSESKIDDALSLVFGGTLLAVGAYMGFGVDIGQTLMSLGSVVRHVGQTALAVTLVVVGMYFLQRRGAYDDFIGVLMMLAGLATIGISLTEYLTQSVILYVVSGALAFAGIWMIANARGKSWSILGLILVVLAVSMIVPGFISSLLPRW